MQVTDLTLGSVADAEAGAALLQPAQKEALKALGEIQELRKAERATARRMMAGAEFAHGRQGSSKGVESKGRQDDTYEAMMKDLKLREQAEAKGAPGSKQQAGHHHRRQLSEKLVDEVIALEIQRDLVRLYSQAQVGTERKERKGGVS